MSVATLINASVDVVRKTYTTDAAGSAAVGSTANAYTGTNCHAHLENQFEAVEMGGIKKNSTAFFVFPLDLSIFMDDFVTWLGVKYQVVSVNRRVKPGGVFSHVEVRGEAIQNGTT